MTTVLGMSFEEAQELYIHVVYALPFLSIPIYSMFAMLGKGQTRRAFYFSLSTPGLITLAFVIWDALTATPEPYFLHPARSLLMFCLILQPGYWIFPLVWTIQVALMIRGKWGELRWSSLAACVGLLLLYAWDGLGINVARYALDLRADPIFAQNRLIERSAATRLVPCG
jgi:hypothetical protein